MGVDSSSRAPDDGAEGRQVNLVLVQVYVETDDYLLRDEDGVGVSMFANRDIGEDERVLRAPVGPRESNERIATVGPAGMVPERRAFMERFLVWQEKYGSGRKYAGGTKSDVPVFAEPDFARRFDRDEPAVRFPAPGDGGNPSYFFSLLDDDYLVVEFVPCAAGGEAALPECRRFEVLDYDEAIHWDGEEGYDPATLRRPPVVDTTEAERGLEIPGHYSNHASGETASVYDTVRLRRDGDDRGGEGCGDGEIVAPAMSAEYNAQLRERTANGVEPAPGTPLYDTPNVMTAHRAMKKGDEIRSDYALWHWSNEHYAAGKLSLKHNDLYWSELPSDVRDAATSLGISGCMWDHGDVVVDLNHVPFEKLSPSQQGWANTIGYTPSAWDLVLGDLQPWFRCLCGDRKCHSRDGFRGAKYFSLEEQKRCYWLFGPYMRQQVDWRIYRHGKLRGGGNAAVATPQEKKLEQE